MNNRIAQFYIVKYDLVFKKKPVCNTHLHFAAESKVSFCWSSIITPSRFILSKREKLTCLMLILLFSSFDNLLVTSLAMIFWPQSVLIKIVPAIMRNSSVIRTHLTIFLKVFRSSTLEV
jgi:hypothetical protein